MRVLFLTYKGSPDNGYDIVGMNLCRELAAGQGIAVDAYTFSGKALFQSGNSCLKSIYLLKAGWMAILHDVVCLWLKLRHHRYDLIHCNVEHYAPAAMLLSKLSGIPYSVTCHGTYGVLLPRRMSVCRRAFERADRLISVSRYTADRMHGTAGIRAQISVIHNGVDTSVFRPDSGVRKENLITFVGNMKRRKGFPFLVDALIAARDNGARFRLAVVGELGSGRLEEVERARASGLDVVLSGPLNIDELVDLYRRSKLNVLPSLSEPEYFEGFGLVHLEANACGTLTAGTVDSGNREAIRPGNGFLVDYGDVGALSRIICELMAEEDPESLVPADRDIRTWAMAAAGYASAFRSAVDARKRNVRNR